MMPRRFLLPTVCFLVVCGLVVGSLVPSAPAEDLVEKMNKRMAPAEALAAEDTSDPIGLLRRAATFVDQQPTTSLELVYHLELSEGGEKKEEAHSTYRVLMAEGGKFAVGPVGDTHGPTVHSDGSAMILFPPNPAMRSSTYGIRGGIAAFATNRVTQYIGHGLGGLTLSMLSPLAADSLLGASKDAVYVGKETITIDGAEHVCHHGRLTTVDLTWDFWVDAGAKPLLRRILPDLSEEPAEGVDPAEVEQARLVINFENWDLETPIASEAFATEKRPHALLGKNPPAVSLPLLKGGAQRLEELVGKKVIVLDFWATSCPECVRTLPILEEVVEKYSDRGVVAFAVNVGEDPDSIESFIEQRGWSLPMVLDGDGSIGAKLQLGEGLPSSMVIGLDGKVQHVGVGVPRDNEVYRSELTKEFELLLGKKDLAGESLARWKAMQAVFADEG